MKKLAALSVSILALFATACGDDGADDTASAAEEREATSSTTLDADGEGGGTSDDEGAGGESAAEGGADPAANPELCAAFERVQTLDDEISAQVEEAMATIMASPEEVTEQSLEEWGRRISDIIAGIDRGEIDRIYEELAANVPADARAHVDALHQGTVRMLDAFGSGLSNLGELANETAQEDVAAMVEATQALDEISREQCDIVIAD